MKEVRGVWLSLAGAFTLGLPAAAQQPAFALDGRAVALRLRSEVPADTQGLTGLGFRIDGRAGLGPVRIDVEYTQGSVTSAVASVPGEDVADGHAMLGVRPFPWVTVDAGPQVRAYVIGGATQRWVLWEVRARAEGALIPGVITGYVGAWRAISGSVNLAATFDHAQGGEVGACVRTTRLPLALELGYTIDATALGGAGRRAILEGLTVGIGFASRSGVSFPP